MYSKTIKFEIIKLYKRPFSKFKKDIIAEFLQKKYFCNEENTKQYI
jgi:hypothetical protein